MPTDLATLETIGLQEIPAWYRDKHNVPSLRSRSRVGAGFTQNNWRKPRATPMKTIEQKHETKSVKTETKTITPETSPAGETVTEGQTNDDPLDLVYRAGGLKLTSGNTTNGSSPVTPPNLSRFLDFERIGSASFHYKYDAPQTPTGSGPVRSRRLFEAQAPNHEYSTSPDSLPSMTYTKDSFSPFSSLGRTPRSTTGQLAVSNMTKRFSVAEEDLNAADDTLENLSNELAKFDNSEPMYRSISELLDSSIPEDRYGNLILF
jgi:hypothetical protein